MHSIKLIGIGNGRYLQIKSNLKAALNQMGKEQLLEEVRAVETILEYKLDAIPAVLVNDKVIFDDGVIPSVEEFKYLIKRASSKAESVDTILVPIDFSDTSKNAFLYAQQLAEVLGSEIQLVHVTLPSSSPPMPHTPSVYFEEHSEYAMEQMKHFVQNNTLVRTNGMVSPTVKIDTNVIVGYTGEELVRFSKEKSVDMVVMGTTGESTLLRKMFGSVSTYVCKNAWTPVLLIPKGTSYKEVKNIVFATDKERVDRHFLKTLQPLLRSFNAFVHTVHVKRDSSTHYELKDVKIEKINGLPELAYKSVIIKSESIAYGLNSYIEQNDVGMLVMITSHKGFAENLLRHSTTKRMVFNTEIPLMILHYQD